MYITITYLENLINENCTILTFYMHIHIFLKSYLGVENGTSKNVGLGKFWQDLEILKAFLISLEVSFLHGLFYLF